MQFAGGVILALVMLAGAGAYVTHVSRRVNAVLPPAARARTERARGAAHASVRTIRAQARADFWLDRHRARLAAASPKPAASARAASAARSAGRGTVALARKARPAASAAFRRAVIPAGSAAVMTAGAETRLASVTPLRTPAPSNGHAPPPAAPAASAAPNGKAQPMTTSTVSSGGTGASADLFSAVQQITGHARSGGIRAKQRAIVTLSESMDYMAQHVSQFAQGLAEPDQNYPAAVWEAVSQAAAHLKAAAISSSEGGSALSAMMAMTVGELAGSSVRAPHHHELNSDA